MNHKYRDELSVKMEPKKEYFNSTICGIMRTLNNGKLVCNMEGCWCKLNDSENSLKI